MRPPHYFFWANLVLRTPTDAWAVYELEGQSYPGLSDSRKIEVGERLEALAYTLESDFQVLRIAPAFDAAAYERRALSTLDPRHGRRERFERHLAEHRAEFERRGALRPEIYLAVRLGAPGGAGALGGLLDGAAAAWRTLAERVGFEQARGIGRERLAALRAAEEGAYERVLGYLECSRVGPRRLAGLIRRAYTRGLGEPDADESFQPQALSFLDPGGEERFEPYGYDLLRLHESRVTVQRRSLLIDSERGRAHQAQLVLGAMPEEALVPGPSAELMFTPLELGFAVDATLSVEFVANREARRQVAKRKVDADQIAREESAGDHGPSVEGAERPHLARELEAVLGGGDRPPLLRSALLLSVAGREEAELEERVERLRESYGRVQLHCPGGEQHRLFLASLPAATFPLPEYKEHLLPDQLGAMVPHAISHAGSAIGPYIGYTLTGSRAPVQFDLAEACQQSRPPTCLLAGSLGSGKTICLELAVWQAFLQGSAPIVDIDPKGDHRLERLPGVAGAIETIELSGEERYRGLLDPMRVGAQETREDLAYNFLVSILPAPVKPEWQTQLRLAVSEAAAAGARSCGEVLERLAASGEPDAAEAARAVEVHASSGLARLGLGSAETELAEVGDAQLVSLRIRNLTLPLAGTARAELLAEERTSLAVLRLLAAYALRLCATDTARHSVLAMDEAWALTSDTQGRALLERISRLGRSQNITPILATQMLGDAAELEPLVGALFAFGVETEVEARKALALLRLDPDDEAQVQRLIGYRAGRCYLRDFAGQVAPVQIDPPRWLLGELDTTPRREEAQASRPAAPPDDLPEAADAVAP
ncbi:MAG TPA: ATP-binding protein [Solirubrobacterales bacterium]|nr:ATP-binding protein [Solirubrobacterales bacterium]